LSSRRSPPIDARPQAILQIRTDEGVVNRLLNNWFMTLRHDNALDGVAGLVSRSGEFGLVDMLHVVDRVPSCARLWQPRHIALEGIVAPAQ
jgi:hypothetical protein